MAMIQDAVVGLLAREPAHGYALWQTLRGWSSDPDSIQASSVYMALKRLNEGGAVRVVGSVGAHGIGERPRLTFALTGSGRERYGRWLAEAPSSAEDLRLRIALAQPPDDLAALIDWVADALDDIQCRLGELSASHRPAADRDAWEEHCAMAVAQLRFRELSARAQWLAEAHAQLHGLQRLALDLRT